MSWTLARYIGARFAGVLSWSMLVAFAVILLGAGVEMLREDAPIAVVLQIAALKAPTVALTALPFVVMLSALACFARLARSAELVVTRAAGVSVWTLIAPAVAISVALGLVATAALNPVAAGAQSRAERLEARWFGGGVDRLSVSQEGVWLRQGATEADADLQTVIHARDVDVQSMTLRRVTFFGLSAEGGVRQRIDAASATLAPGAWRLRDGVLRDIGADPDAPPRETVFATRDAATTLTRAQIVDSFDRPEAISFWRLPSFIAALEDAGFSAVRHRLHWQSQLAAPLLFAGMAMIGAAFSMRHIRFGGLGAMALYAVAAGFGLFFVTDLAKALGGGGAVPVAVAAWAPPLAAVALSAALLLHLEDG